MGRKMDPFSGTEIMRLDPDHPDRTIILRAAEIIRAGGVVVFPTRALYGIGTNAFDMEAVDRVFKIKRRPKNKPLPILIKSRSDLEHLAAEIPEPAIRLMDRFWPGKLTIVFMASPSLPEHLAGRTKTIAVRLPAHPVAAALANAAGCPITATSANLSGHTGCSDICCLPESITKNADMVLDAGPLSGGTGSTIIDVTKPPPVILRQGDIRIPWI